MKTLHELFEDGMKDMYNAEKQLIKALPKMAKMAKDQRLKEGFQNHLKQTEGHAQRIEEACLSLNMKPSGMVCRAMKGLIEEANEHTKGLKSGSCTDAELINLAQKVEHYEIGSYGTLCEWARIMGHEDAMNLLHQNLDEEKQTNDFLTDVAEGNVNQMAADESEQMMMDGHGTIGGTTRSRAATRRSTARPPTRAKRKPATGRTPSGHSKTSGTSRSKSPASRAKPKSRGRATAR